MNNKKGIIQIIIGSIIGIVTANVFSDKSIVTQFMCTIFFAVIAISIIELVYFFKKP